MRHHETFGSHYIGDTSLVEQVMLNMKRYDGIPGMIVELDSNYCLRRCTITDNIYSILEWYLRERQLDSVIEIYTYMGPKDWHYWLGKAKQDLKRSMK